MPQGLDDFMKEIGQPTGGKISTDAPQPETAAPSDEQLDWQQRAGKGVAKSLAGTVTGIPRAINAGIGLVSPALRQRLGDLAEQIPGVQRMEEFAQEPSSSWAETGGYLGGEVAQLFGPGAMRAGGKAAETISPVFRGTRGAYSDTSFVPEITRAGSNRPPPGFLAKTAKAAGTGAAAGAMTDPEDPGAGALLGGVTAGLTPGLGKLAQTKGGQFLAGHAARAVPIGAIEEVARYFGIPSQLLWELGVLPMIKYWHSPIGRRIGSAGKTAAGWAGQRMEEGVGIPQIFPNIPGGAIQGGLSGLAEGAAEGYVPKYFAPAEESNGQSDQSEEPARP